MTATGSSSAGTIRTRVTRDDLEAKFREVREQVDTATESATSVAIAAGAVAAVVVLGLVYWSGKRRGRKATTVVEIKRY